MQVVAPRIVSIVLSATLIAPSVFAQGAKPPADTKPSPPPAAAAPAASQAPAPLAESLTGMAKAEYEAGRILYADGDFASAALKFDRAYQESKDPRLLWNVAAAEKNLRHYARVEALVTRYMQESGDKLTENDRAEAQALLDTVRAFIAEVTFKVNEPGATLSIDNEQVGQTPLAAPLRVEMGERKVRVTKPGFTEFNETVRFAGGTQQTVEVTLKADVHEGRLRVVAGAADSISIDGKFVGTGQWEGKLPSGIHTLVVSAPGKRTYQSDVAVQDGQLSTSRITLEADVGPSAAPAGVPTWLWITGGVALAGLGVGAYFIFKPDDEGAPAPVDGSLGTVELPFGL
jgi:hypothetical protein